VDPLVTRRHSPRHYSQRLPLIVAAAVILSIVGAAWWVASSAFQVGAAALLPDPAAVLGQLDRAPQTDTGCLACHTDRAALQADLERNPVAAPPKSTASEGEG